MDSLVLIGQKCSQQHGIGDFCRTSSRPVGPVTTFRQMMPALSQIVELLTARVTKPTSGIRSVGMTADKYVSLAPRVTLLRLCLA